MKLIYVSSPLTSSFGGGERFIDNLTSGLNRDEHVFIGSSQALYNLFKQKGYQAHLSSGGLEPVTIKNLLLTPFSLILGLIQVWKYRKIWQEADWIISPTAFTEIFFVLPYIWLFYRTKMLFIMQNRCPKAIYISPLLLVLKWLWQKHPVVFMSQSQFNDWRQKNVIGQKNIIIPQGVAVDKFELEQNIGKNKVNSTEIGTNFKDSANQAANEDNIRLKSNINQQKRVTLGFLARMHQEKGLDTFLKALAILKTPLEIQVNLGGDGPELENWKKLAANLNLPKNINLNWLGFVSNAREFYSQIDLFVFPSRREAFGLVVAESWERGVSTLVSDLEVFKELKKYTNDWEQKLLFKLDNPEDLAQKIEYFLENMQNYCSLEQKKHLHKVVVDNFSLNQMITKYRQILEG
jgi:glycosyltransferase involved in cell wall biosynthesis